MPFREEGPLSEWFESTAQVRLAPESIEALALRITELLGAREAPHKSHPERISASEVARQWGIGRRWVYEHADELGAWRLGAGNRPRLRFDPDEVAERLGDPASHAGLAPVSGDRS